MSGGQGIRTLEELAPLAVFKTAALGHYASPPGPHTLPKPKISGTTTIRTSVSGWSGPPRNVSVEISDAGIFRYFATLMPIRHNIP